MTRAEIFALPLDDPRYVEHMRTQLPRLRERTVRRITALHYLIERDKVYCLDLGISAESVEAMDEQVGPEFLKLGMDAIPHHASEEMWMKLVATPLVRQYRLMVLDESFNLKVSVHK